MRQWIINWKANLRFSLSQFDIMENYKPFITKGFASLIGVKTSLQSIKLLSYCVIRETNNVTTGYFKRGITMIDISCGFKHVRFT
jgi:hypothetical protein